MGSRLNIKREFSINFNNLTMAGRVYGEGHKTPLLGLHGWLDNAASFEIIARQLPEVKLIALDFIGHGKSSHRCAHHPYYIWDNVTDLYCALQALDIEKIDILGHSMGASVAMLFAACFPEKVGRLWLIEGLAPLHYRADQLPNIMAGAIRKRVAVAGRRSRINPDINRLIDARASGHFPVSREAAKMLVNRGTVFGEGGYRWSSDPALLLPSINRMGIAQIEAFLQSLDMPVTLYLGDKGLLDAQWQQYFKHIKQLQQYTFTGNHHLHMQEHGASLIAKSIATHYGHPVSL
ncbi:MAG: alpha/beta fold hydrolase [Oceanospirillaceae bacterium]|nr:alpha/beta fold hydrolase [Oceanospirillaceae bacterium]